MATKILLIDDDTRILETFTRALKLAGYDVLTAINGEEGLALYHEEAPDIVLLDLRMPRMSGLEALQAMREHDPEANVILATGHGDKDAVIEALRAGASDFLSKPIDQVSLESALRRAEERIELKRKLRASQEALRQQNVQLEATVQARTEELTNTIALLQKSETRFRTLFETMIEGVALHQVIYNEAGAAVDYVLLDANPAYQHHTGISVEEACGKKASELYSAEEPPYLDLYTRVAETGEPTAFETYFPPMKRHFSISVFSPAEGQFATVFEDVTEQKLVEEELQESLAKYRVLFDAFPLGITIADTSGNILEANRESERLLGISREEHERRDIDGEEWHIIRPDGSPMPAEEYASVRALKEGRSVSNVEAGIVKPDDEITWINVTAAPLMDDRVVIAYNDITARKQIEETLAESEALHRVILNNMSDAVFITDATGAFTFICPNVDVIFGYFFDEVKSFGYISKLLGPDIYAPDALEAAGELQNIERVITTKAGHQRILWVNVKRVHIKDGVVLYTCRDVTNQRQAEVALRESEERFREVMNSAPLGVGIGDAQGNMIDCNAALAEMLGYTPEEILTSNFADFTHPDDLEREWQLIKQIADGEIDDYIIEKRYIHRDGHSLWALLATSVLRDASGAPRLGFIFVQDITERKQAEQALRESEEKYRLLAETTRDIIVLHDMEGRISYANQAGLDFAGFSAAEALGQPITTFIPPDHLADIETRRKQRASGDDQPYRYETEFVNQSGQRVPVEVHSTPILREDHVREILLVARDITEREYAKKAILAERERLDNILAVLETGLSLIKPDMTIVWVNRKTHQMFPDEEPIGQKCHEFYESRDTPCKGCATAAAFETGEVHIYERYNEKYGRWHRTVAQPIKDETGAVVSVLEGVTDITERRQAEEQLRFQAHLLDAVEQAIIVTDLNGRVVYWNPFAEQIYGWPAEEAMGRTTLELIGSEQSQQHAAKIMAYLQQGKSWSGEYLARHRDGTNFPISVTCTPISDKRGELTHIIGSSADISRRKEAEKALKTSEEQYRQLVETSPDSITLTDLKGNVLMCNQRTAELHGYERPQDVIGQSAFQFIVPEDIEEAQVNLRKALRGLPIRNLEYRTIHKDGGQLCVELNASLIRDEEGRPKAFIGVTRDITQRKKMEAQIEAYTEQLEQIVDKKMRELERERAKALQMDKLASLGEMATGMAHELNQSLTAIGYEADYLQNVAKKTHNDHGDDLNTLLNVAQVMKIGEGIREDLTRCRRLIDHLRDFGRISKELPAPICLNDPIEDSLIIVGERLRNHGVEVQLDLTDDLPLIMANSHRLEQVFLNLISNAEHAMEQKAAEGPGYQKVLEIATAATASEVIATVRDNGCGVPEDVRGRIFDPFFTTKPRGEGTGLGLSISYGIVTDYRGEITCESVEGEGTTFTLSFPITERKGT